MKRSCLNCKHFVVDVHFFGGDVTPPEYERGCMKELNFEEHQSDATECSGWEEETTKEVVEEKKDDLESVENWESVDEKDDE